MRLGTFNVDVSGVGRMLYTDYHSLQTDHQIPTKIGRSTRNRACDRTVAAGAFRSSFGVGDVCSDKDKTTFTLCIVSYIMIAHVFILYIMYAEMLRPMER